MERTSERRAKNAAHARLALRYPDVEYVKRRLEELGIPYPGFFRGNKEVEGMDYREYELELYNILGKYE
jgi:hypothetical protein